MSKSNGPQETVPASEPSFPSPEPEPAFRSSKPRTLYIQLEDYTLFHSPSQIDDIDRRFIGRRTVVDRLKLLLTNSDTRSGAYLVTGYRGMGKSSAVSKALNEIYPSASGLKRSSRYSRIFAPLAVLPLLIPALSPPLFWIPVGIAVALVAYLAANSPLIDDLSPSARVQRPWLQRFGRFVKAWFRTAWHNLVVFEPVPGGRARMLIQDFYLVLLIHAISIVVIYALQRRFGDLRFSTRLTVYVLITFCLIGGNLIASYAKRRPEIAAVPASDDDDIGVAKRVARWLLRPARLIRSYVWHLHAQTRQYLCHSMQVHVRINLGYENLSELAVLRLVARSIQSHYTAKVKSFSFPQLSWTAAKFVSVFLVLGIFYHYEPFFAVHQAIKSESGLTTLCPSQTVAWEPGTPRNRAAATSPSAADQRWFLGVVSNRIRRDGGLIQGFDLTGYLNDVGRISGTALERPDTAGWTGRFIVATTYADLLLQGAYGAVVEQLPQPVAWIAEKLQTPVDRYTKVGLSSQFSLLPKSLDYLFWIYFGLVWYGFGLVASRPIFGIVTHGAIISRIKRLNDLVDAQVTEHRMSQAGNKQWLAALVQRGRTKTFPRADEREIEKQLVDILADIRRIPRIIRRPEFVFVFDELDKIEPHQGLGLTAKDEEQILTGDSASAAATQRNRQQNVLRLLSNLKHFLTTARAKFIFIAGRELFDAALADVSDRNFFIGSIFNDVIYVDSFLKDRAIDPQADTRRHGITQMTEHYVCAALLPSRYALTECSLDGYQAYLTGTYGYQSDSAELIKVVATLRDFVTYLTYRTNGAPKKLAAIFERYVVRVRKEVLQDEVNPVLCVGRQSRALYLRFDWYDQYAFGVGSHLVTPFFVSLDNVLREFGDKLLVSSSFLIDHLYKFHGVGFSWRHIELTPEILDINKAPHVRELIASLIHHLDVHGHIRLIDNGLYNFKFRRKISDEITVLSKLNEHESAAFNFTLDESLTTKQHYKRQLRELEAVYKPYFGAATAPEFIRSISFVHMILGDLHFYDEEYDNAIVEYMEAIHLFKGDMPASVPIELFVLLVRNTLKLGLAFEKRKTYDSAFVTYGKLASRVAQFREGPQADVVAGRPAEVLVSPGSDLSRIPKEPRAPEPDLDARTEYLRFRNTVVETLRLLYQPFLAKFQILEKLRPEGIGPEDIDQILSEFKFVVENLAQDRQQKKIAGADFRQRLGHVLFYKNAPSATVDIGHPTASGGAAIYCHRDGCRCSRNDHVAESLHRRSFRTPCDACELYMDALNRLCADLPDAEMPEAGAPYHQLFSLLQAMRREVVDGAQRAPAARQATASLLSDIADTFLSCATDKDPLRWKFARLLMYVTSSRRTNRKTAELRAFFRRNKAPLSKLEEALIYSALAAGYYRRVGDHRSAGWQLTKIMYVIRDYYRWVRPKADRARSTNATEQATPAGTEPPTAPSNRLPTDPAAAADKEFTKLKNRLRALTYQLADQACWRLAGNPGGTAPANPKPGPEGTKPTWDVREVTLLRDAIIQLLDDPTHCHATGNGSAVSPYSLVDSMYNRILDLRAQCRLNHGIYTHSRDAGTKREAVIDSIYCYSEMLRLCRMYGPSYVINHSLVATAFERLGACYEDYEALRSQKHDRDQWDKKLESLIGSSVHNAASLARSHYSSALKHYQLTLETHSEGGAYKAIIDGMNYLNEDFEDDLSHFCAAQERYWSHVGDVYGRIERIKEKLRPPRPTPGGRHPRVQQ